LIRICRAVYLILFSGQNKVAQSSKKFDSLVMRVFSKAVTPFMPLPSTELLRSSDDCLLDSFFDSKEMLSSGRDAFFRIAKLEEKPCELWIPKFFCPNLKKTLSEFYTLKFFDDYPSSDTTDFESITPKENALVLFVDFFGLRGNKKNIDLWTNWKQSQKNVKLIGDFSHAPFNPIAENNIFDYSFASFRKTLTLPDGAWFKSAKNPPSKMFWIRSAPADSQDFASDFLQAAALCNTYGAISHTESEYLYYKAETKLNARKKFGRMCAYSAKTLRRFKLEEMELIRFENTKIFAEEFLNLAGDFAEELNVKFDNLISPQNHSVFAPTLIFKSQEKRDAVYDALSKAGARPCIYWGGLGKSAGEKALSEESLILTIPLDFRHTKRDAITAARISAEAICS